MIRQIAVRRPGDAKVLELIEKENSQKNLASNEVLIKVAFSGVNFADLMMRQGLYPDAPPYPFVPGYEVGGYVLECGEKVDGLAPGDRVMAGCHFGGYSSQVVAPCHQVKVIPSNWSLEQAAAFPVSFFTAFMALFELARIRPEDSLFIDCASGALGQMVAALIQSHFTPEQRGLLYGATSSSNKLSRLNELGFKAIEYDEWIKSNQKVDIVINSKGGDSLRRDFNKLNSCGRLVCLGASDILMPGKRNIFHALKTFWKMPKFSSIELMNENKGVHGLNVLRILEKEEVIRKVWKGLPHGLTPAKPHHIFSWREVSKAHEFIESKKSFGKVLLSWEDQ